MYGYKRVAVGWMVLGWWLAVGWCFGALPMGLVGARDDIDIFGTSEFINIVELELV